MGHGLSNTQIYSVWTNMKATCKRCSVSMEKDWEYFLKFYEWAISSGHEEGLYLERKDKRKGYYPENVRWVIKDTRKIHGQYNTPLYKIWTGIKQRCQNSKDTNYENYGGRGIEVCEEWSNSFEEFLKWANQYGFVEGLTLDRIDYNGNYEPTNCRWITMQEQLHNTRRNVFIEINGIRKTLTQWAKFYGINPVTASQRYRAGLRGNDLFKEPQNTSSPINLEINGEIQSLSQWARENGIKEKTIQQRYRNGLRGEELFKKRIAKPNEYIVEIEGESKPLKHWADENNVSYDVILSRYKKGIRGTELLKQENDKEIYVEIDGVIKTLSSWARDTEGVTYSAISQRYRNGIRGNDLLKSNKKVIIEYEYNGKKQSLSKWAKDIGVNDETIRRRYHEEKRGEELLSPPKKKKVKIEYNGKVVSVDELAAITGINSSTIRSRYRRGLRGEDLLK